MIYASPFNPNQAEVLAVLASLRLWLADALCWLGLGRWPRGELDAATATVKHALFLRAFLRTDIARRRQRPGMRLHHAHARQSARNSLRALTGRVLKGLHTGTTQERIARLRALLDTPEPVIARIARRIARIAGRMRPIRFIHTIARALGAPHRAPRAAATCADTS